MPIFGILAIFAPVLGLGGRWSLEMLGQPVEISRQSPRKAHARKEAGAGVTHRAEEIGFPHAQWKAHFVVGLVRPPRGDDRPGDAPRPGPGRWCACGPPDRRAGLVGAGGDALDGRRFGAGPGVDRGPGDRGAGLAGRVVRRGGAASRRRLEARFRANGPGARPDRGPHEFEPRAEGGGPGGARADRGRPGGAAAHPGAGGGGDRRRASARGTPWRSACSRGTGRSRRGRTSRSRSA